ncbi:MAG: hypothetical protein ACR2JB_10095 [Bryobacteraceae bacterium]
MLFRQIISASLLTTAFGAVANAQSSAQQPVKLTGIETKIELIRTGKLPSPANAFSSLAKPKKFKIREGIERDLVAARKSTISSGFASTFSALQNPNPSPSTVVGPEPTFFGFPGLTSFDLGITTGFVLEPPDQGLAVANGFVFEAINDILGLYDTSGVLVAGPAYINDFFGLPFEAFGSDPKVYFDHELQRWFISIVELDVDPNTGDLTGRSHVYFAVSTSQDPLALFNIYAIDTTNDASLGTPAHPGCPCFGDQPLIGADKYGFYISTNEYSIFGPSFNGANIYALSKESLALGTLPTPILFSGLPLAEAVGYSVKPAISLGFQNEHPSGLEYFVSALDFFGTLDNRIAVWAMLNTSSLSSVHPHPILTNQIITSQVYGQPPPARQKPGPFPLGMSLCEKLEYLNSNDDRMNQVVYENGKLWSGLNTIVGGYDGKAVRAGIAYFVVDPGVNGGVLTATITKQGYVAAPGKDSVIFPAIGATPDGRAAMVFTLVGPTPTPAFLFSDVFYPSMAFTTLSATSGTGDIQLGGAGYAPEDGFSGYPEFGGDGVARWGDYSAAVADTDGSIWMATEWIPNTPRTEYTNWGTFIGQLR